MPRTISKYGWCPDLPDHRDHFYSVVVQPTKLTPSVDLREQCPPVYDQGQLGSCTANAISGAFEFEQMKQKLTPFMPSRLFIYYNERAMEGTVHQDSGAQIRDGIKSVNTQGVCPESMWPYNDTGIQFIQKPSDDCYSTAAKNLVITYQRLSQNLNMMKGCLASGYPFVFGFTVYDGFESEQVANTGMLKMPTRGEKQVGGHAIMAVGYEDSLNSFIIRNSWGSGWGVKGYFYMPYTYATNSGLADDFWTIRIVE
jgi:C1A family cysteine protease